ncbi:MAG: hypothetical protein ACYS0K_20225 [Planctomycetota bacterium]
MLPKRPSNHAGLVDRGSIPALPDEGEQVGEGVGPNPTVLLPQAPSRLERDPTGRASRSTPTIRHMSIHP